MYYDFVAANSPVSYGTQTLSAFLNLTIEHWKFNVVYLRKLSGWACQSIPCNPWAHVKRPSKTVFPSFRPMFLTKRYWWSIEYWTFCILLQGAPASGFLQRSPQRKIKRDRNMLGTALQNQLGSLFAHHLEITGDGGNAIEDDLLQRRFIVGDHAYLFAHL